jgi:hypothetical protein
VKRFVAVLALLVLPVVGFTSEAGAVGYGVCTITGTMTFAPTSESAGTWSIGPAVLDCQGLIAARRRITGRGPLKGSGTYKALAAGDGCLRQSGTGTVEYRIPTTAGDILVNEPWDHALAGAGMINTPTLRGLFEVTPAAGDCLTKPVTRATLFGQAGLLRYPREIPRKFPYIS